MTPIIVAFVAGLLAALPGIAAALNQRKKDKASYDDQLNDRILKYTAKLEQRITNLENTLGEREQEIEDLRTENKDLHRKLSESEAARLTLELQLNRLKERVSEIERKSDTGELKHG